MAKPDKHLDVVVVVSGQPTAVRINANQELEKLVREALRESGNKGQDPSSWELRLEGGDLLDLGQRAGEAGLIDGMTLYLNPRAGAGG